jgi:hypothetical protein
MADFVRPDDDKGLRSAPRLVLLHRRCIITRRIVRLTIYRLAKAAETQFNAVKDDESIPPTQLNAPLDTYRRICEELSLRDPVLATSKDIDSNLWVAHNEVNKRFQKAISEVS